jgi:anti-sigma factor RsiW
MMCVDYEERVDQFIDGELPSAQTAGMFAHLGTCDACRTYFHSATAINTAMMQAPPIRMRQSIVEAGKDILPARERVLRGVMPDWSVASFHLWKKKISLPVTALLLCLTVIGSFSVTYLWTVKQDHSQELIEPVIHMRLPTVEVKGCLEQPISNPH